MGATSDSQLQLLLAGTEKHFLKTTFVLLGNSYTGKAIVALIRARLASSKKVTTTRATYRAAVAANETKIEESSEILSAYAQIVKLMHGKTPDILADLGLSPRRPGRALTVEEKEVAVAKRAATRKARGTMGKRQKAKVKGGVASAAPSQVNANPETPPSPNVPARSTNST